MIAALNYTIYLGENGALQKAVNAINHFLITSKQCCFFSLLDHIDRNSIYLKCS